MIALSDTQEAAVMRGARQVRESMRDDYFKAVSDRLRGIRELRDSDVNHAVGVAVAMYREHTLA
jgi:hypothetical protein